MVAVKQLILILIVYIVSFLPSFLISIGISVWTIYLLYINHVANFFIYLAVNTEFRNETKAMINIIWKKKVRPCQEETIFALR